MLNLKFLAPTVPEIWRGSKNSKSRSRDLFLTPFDLISLVPSVVNPHVSTSKRTPDMEGVPKFER